MQKLWRNSSYLASDFDLTDIDRQPHGKFVWKAMCFKAQPSTVISSEKGRMMNTKTTVCMCKNGLCFVASVYYHLPSWRCLTEARIFVGLINLPHVPVLISGPSEICLLPYFKNNLQSQEESKKTKTPLDSEIVLSHKKKALLW